MDSNSLFGIEIQNLEKVIEGHLPKNDKLRKEFLEQIEEFKKETADMMTEENHEKLDELKFEIYQQILEKSLGKDIGPLPFEQMEQEWSEIDPIELSKTLVDLMERFQEDEVDVDTMQALKFLADAQIEIQDLIEKNTDLPTEEMVHNLYEFAKVIEQRAEEVEIPEAMKKQMLEMLKEYLKHKISEIDKTSLALTIANEGADLIPFVGPIKMITESMMGKRANGKKLNSKQKKLKFIEGALFLGLDFVTLGGAGAIRGGRAAVRVGTSIKRVEKLKKFGDGVITLGNFYMRHASVITKIARARKTTKKVWRKKRRKLYRKLEDKKKRTWKVPSLSSLKDMLKMPNMFDLIKTWLLNFLSNIKDSFFGWLFSLFKLNKKEQEAAFEGLRSLEEKLLPEKKGVYSSMVERALTAGVDIVKFLAQNNALLGDLVTVTEQLFEKKDKKTFVDTLKLAYLVLEKVPLMEDYIEGSLKEFPGFKEISYLIDKDLADKIYKDNDSEAVSQMMKKILALLEGVANQLSFSELKEKAKQSLSKEKDKTSLVESLFVRSWKELQEYFEPKDEEKNKEQKDLSFDVLIEKITAGKNAIPVLRKFHAFYTILKKLEKLEKYLPHSIIKLPGFTVLVRSIDKDLAKRLEQGDTSLQSNALTLIKEKIKTMLDKKYYFSPFLH